MKTKELFRGALVYRYKKIGTARNGNLFFIPERISSVYEDLGIAFIKDDSYFVSALYPVPLSEEILLHMGFEKTLTGFSAGHLSIRPSHTGIPSDTWETESGKVFSYAHQLQKYLKEENIKTNIDEETSQNTEIRNGGRVA